MKMCEHMTITFIPLDAPASGDPGGDLRWRSSLPAKLGPFYEVMGDHGSPAGTSVRLLKYTLAAIPNYNLLRNSATVMAVAMAAFRDSEPLSFLGYGGM